MGDSMMVRSSFPQSGCDGPVRPRSTARPCAGEPWSPSVTFSDAATSGSFTLSTIVCVAKSSVTKPLRFDSCANTRFVDPSAPVSNAIGRTPSSVGTLQTTSSVF